MSEESKYWSSGSWMVSEGKADEFIERWTAFLTWTKEANENFHYARLVRDVGDPGHFISFASWRDPDSMAAWKERPEFAEHFGGCRALCDDVQAGGYVLTVSV
ncbi:MULTISPECIES: antibiotic biosynthesis monooxygenase family protein [unclassified Streptomyces]|uniref:antibiotic biosynthesis monooxygenase family protein n=1 Tax=unclassified Streptomyces TaxID=2593676 RepID=UPI001BE776D2|nr:MULTISPECIES: antibiotic biosynthesis monooxygenase family protein [unclassified Streptomyces]MBT2406104.1 antibiotic biosynthesis monooxygenase [Streptomyces sp. ISL-21]MBT2457749.1 antibiotic biosynthesis monooxygenase [Streptomyces sp. ISL-86]MBT2609162.1 antibiotic biosynthesis monooxygenase [Streptomyces sp. ISL-87]